MIVSTYRQNVSVSLMQMFLNIPFSKSNTYLWHTVVLSYGSLVYKHCAYYTPCPVNAVQVIKRRNKSPSFGKDLRFQAETHNNTIKITTIW